MKKISFLLPALLLLSLLIIWLRPEAQAQDKLPPFSMLLTNGKLFSTADLSATKPTVLIYFAPDCDHCQVLLKAFFKKMDAFKNTEIMLVTFKKVNVLFDFEKGYQTNKYPNVHVGAETKPLYLQAFFKLQNTPFTALYDKNKSLIVSYKKDTLVTDLIRQLKNLK